MKKRLTILLWSMVACCALGFAQAAKSELQQKAEEAEKSGGVGSARFHYIRAFEDYASKGDLRQSVECGVKGAGLYHKESYFKEAFELLRRIDQTIDASQKSDGATKAAMHYLTVKERLQMYLKMRKLESAKEQLGRMETLAGSAGDETVSNDLLYNKALFHYTFGQTAQGNAVFKEMAAKLTAQKEYDKVDEVYQTLISNGRRSNNASLVAQSYSNYMAWKDSVAELKRADETNALKQQIAANEASISEKDSSLATRRWIIGALTVLAIALAAALAVGAVVLLRFIALTKRQKKTIKTANENNAMKAKFISNISAQLSPTLQKLDSRTPEVKALLDFATHAQTLSELEQTAGESAEIEEIGMAPFCEGLMDEVRDKAKGLILTVNAPKMSAKVNKEYAAHILRHLLANAVEYTPEGGKVTLEFKKRGAHSYQFLVSDTGSGIAEDQREEVFKPFRAVHDLTQGDGLGLPICKQMAMKMNGDLYIDNAYTKGTRFVLDMHV